MEVGNIGGSTILSKLKVPRFPDKSFRKARKHPHGGPTRLPYASWGGLGWGVRYDEIGLVTNKGVVQLSQIRLRFQEDTADDNRSCPKGVKH